MSTDPTPGHAVVTGATGGIGQAIVQRLLDGRWRVTGLDLGPAVTRHPAYRHVTVDLCDDAATHRALQGLDNATALVHAAGLLRVAPLAQSESADGELMWKLHVDAAVRLTRDLAPAMVAQGGGRVVLARSWGAELAGQGVTVNVVSPAATQTGMLEDPARAASPARMPPIGRLIQPGEIAALVAFLLSAEAAAITGQDIAICGGASLPR